MRQWLNMGQDGETEPKMPKRTKKRTPRGRAKQAQALQFHSIEPLVVRKVCQGTDFKLHQSLVRLLEPECSQQATLRTHGDMPPGTALRESTDVTEMPSTPPASRGFQELLVPDSPDETTTRERTDVTELPSTPPASRDFEDLFVADSPEETWAVGKDTSRRLAKMPRTPPISTNLEELVVPDSPEETWARPHKSLRSPPPSTSFGELVVPESPEERGASKDLSHRPFKLRKTRIRNLHPELVNDRNKAGLGRPYTELISCRTAKQRGKGSSKKAADSRNGDHSHHLDNRLPILAAEMRPGESGSPRVTDGLPTLSAPSLCTPRGDLPAVQFSAMNETDLALGVEELVECPQSQRIVYKNEYLGDTLPLYVPDTEDPAPITPISTIPGMLPVSSVALEQPRAFLFDELVKETGTRVRAGARSEKDLHRDIPTPIRSSVGTPAPTTPFPIASGKPFLKSFRPLKKARAMVLRDELDSSESTVELKGAGHDHNARSAVPTSEMAFDNVVPASFSVAESGKSVLLSSTQFKKATGFVESRLEGSRISHESPGAGFQRNLQRTRSSFSNAEDARPINYPSMGSGKTLSAPRDVQTLTFAAVDGALPLTSLAIGNGNALPASTDGQTPTVSAIDGAIPINSFVPGRAQPVPVSYVALEKVRKLLRDEFEGTEAEFSGPAHRGNLDIDAKALKFSSTVDAAPTNLSMVAMGKTFSASSDFEPILSKVVDNAAPITSLKETKTLAKTALAGDQSTPLGSKFANPEIYTELAGGYQANVSKDLQTARVTNIQHGPPIKPSMADGKTFDAPSYVTSPAIGYAVPITSFVTASGKSLGAVSAQALERVKKFLGDEFEETETTVKDSRAGDQRTLLIGEFEGPENCTECAGPGYQVSVHRDVQTSSVTSIVDVPPKKSSVAGGKAFDAPRYVTSPAIDYAVPMTSFTTASGKSVAAFSAKALERAKKLLGDQFEETETMANVSRSGLSTASEIPIPVTSWGMGKPLLRDAEIETHGHPLLQKATNHSSKPLSKTSERSVLGNSTFDATVLRGSNGDCPSAKLAREFAAFVPGKALEKGQAALGDDEKENRVEFERISNLESLERSHTSRNSGFTADRTRRPPYEIQAECSISQSSHKGERFSPASGMMNGSCSSQRVGRKEIFKGNPPVNHSRRTMTISNDAILAAKIRLAAGVRKGNNSEAGEETKDTDRRPTFTSGSGRAVTISREAIEKATTLLADGMKIASLRDPTSSFLAERAITEVSSLTPSFRTASGRTVAISSEAISKAKDLLAPRGHSPTVLSSPDRELNVQRCFWDEIRSSQSESVFCAVPASLVGPCATVTPRPSQVYQDRDFGQAITAANKSTQLKFHNPNCDPSRAKPPSTVGDYPWKNVRAFKPPRIRSCDIQRSSSNVASGNHEHHQMQPLRPAYLKDRVGPGGRKLRAYIGRPLASEDLSSFNEVRSMAADAAEDFRIQHVTEAGRWESVGSTEIWELLLGHGADILYASKDWVANHYKWIIWKLVSLERKYAQKIARKPVTLDTVLNELKYRYDTELSGWRSAIRRITEGDSSASRAMVLCVSAIRLNGDKEALHEHTGKISASEAAKIEVTDGWYRLNAVLDAPLTEQLRRGRLKVGQKIQVCGATLCCRSDSRPPLEAFEDSFLTLHMNGTYRALQNQRLGFCRGSCLPLSFRIIKPDGGHVPKTYVGVTRVYPILFKEISPEGFPVIRTARAEEIASNKFEQRRAKVVEEAILKLESSSNTSESQDGKDEGCILFEAVEKAAEPDILLADMNPEQLKAFAVYQVKRETSRQVATEDAVKEALQDAGLYSRDVKRFLKVRVTGLQNKSNRNAEVGQQSKDGTITIWDVSDEQNVVEGSVYCVSGLRPGLWGSSGNEDQLQLQSYRSTSWRLVPEAIYEKKFSFPFTCRAPTRISELDEKYVSREFDVAATVLHVGDALQRGSRTEQWVFVTDGSTALSRPGDTWVEKQILAIKVNFPSVAFAPVEPSLVGSVVGFCNLIQQPKDHIRHLWVAEASELCFFSCNFTSRPIKHLQAAADCVSKWATSSRWETDSHRHLVQCLLWEGSQ